MRLRDIHLELRRLVRILRTSWMQVSIYLAVDAEIDTMCCGVSSSGPEGQEALPLPRISELSITEVQQYCMGITDYCFAKLL